jgi:hypothetical protein
MKRLIILGIALLFSCSKEETPNVSYFYQVGIFVGSDKSFHFHESGTEYIYADVHKAKAELYINNRIYSPAKWYYDTLYFDGSLSGNDTVKRYIYDILH